MLVWRFASSTGILQRLLGLKKNFSIFAVTAVTLCEEIAEAV
jgi:hypothetical protein